MAFSFGAPDLQTHLKKIDPNVKSVERAGSGGYKVTYNNGLTRTLSKEGASELQSKFAIPTGQYDYDSETGNLLGEKYLYDYRFVTPQDIARADVNYVAPQTGFNPATYDVSSGVGLKSLQELLDYGASKQQIVDLFKTAPVIGDRMQQLFPELRDLDPYTPVSGLTPEQLSSYDVSTGIGMTKLEDLLNLGATPEQIAEIAGRAPVVGTRLQTLFPQFAAPPPPPPTPFSPNVPAFNYNVPAFNYSGPSFNYNAPPAGLPALVPVSPVSLVQAAEAPVLAPSVQTVAGMKEGGLASVAQDLASKGRYGDTMIAHISPEEAGILKALGGAGTINPETGLPEYFSLFPKRGIKLNLGPLGNVKVGAKSSQLLQAAAAVATGNYFNLPLSTTAIAYGGLRGAVTGNMMEGLQAGLTAYGLGSAYNQYNAAPAAGESGVAGGGTGSMAGGPAGIESGTVSVNPSGAEALPGSYSSVGVESVPATVPSATTVPYESGMGFENALSGGEIEPFMQGEVPLTATRSSTAMLPVSQQPLPYGQSGIPGLDPNVASTAATTAPDGYLARNLPAGVQEYVPDVLLDASGTTLAAGAVLAPGLVSGAQERAAYARQQAALRAEEEEKKRRYQELFASTLGQVPVRTARQGGLMSLAKGGMTYMEAGGTTGLTGMPRDVKGTGDGMSDSVPATIEGVQEARLADGEFVIPADVVADIGNGSSGAGSKKLYDMMDRIRKARHGTTKQPPEIDAEALMPA